MDIARAQVDHFGDHGKRKREASGGLPLNDAWDLRIHVRPARSNFSNALNFCRSAIAPLVRSP
jgi:hypothetical protein